MRVFLALLAIICSGMQVEAAPVHAFSIYGEPKYPAGFSHFDYVNPEAPRGGILKLDAIGTFDSLNPWIMKGTSASGISRIYDTLTTASLDEPFTQYGLLAKNMEIAPDRSWEIFTLREQASFSDGKPVTAADVVFTFNALTKQGSPFWAYYYQDVLSVSALDKHRVKFNFRKGSSRELPLIVGQMSILPKHFWENRDFSKTTLEPPVGSGPYRILQVTPGKRIVYERRKDYWGETLPVNRGQYNFDQISYDYYLDDTVALEAFKGGAYDLRNETSAKLWATGYQSPALTRGDIIKENFRNLQPAGMQAFAFNLRRPLLQDRVLRQAINLAFDFEWTNKTLFYGQYKRTRSYFQNSAMAATGLPSAAELALLEPYRKQLPPEVFTRVFVPPTTSGEERPRANLKQAQQLLLNAGYQFRHSQLFTPNGQPVTLEFLIYQPAFERVVLPFARNLATLGIKLIPRRVDQPQYVERLRRFDYDMVVASFPQSASPGSEQRVYWSSESASQEGSQNYIGIRNPVVDALVEKLINAQTRDQLIASCRALDRVLQWNYYVIPNWYTDSFRIARSKTLAHPATATDGLYALPLDAWWQIQPQGK